MSVIQHEAPKIALMLAHRYEFGGKINPTYWWMSEKYDGVRAYWDGQENLWTRKGTLLRVPAWFTDRLPKGEALDGELMARDFTLTSSIVRSYGEQNWGQVKYFVFDTPSRSEELFEARMALISKWCGAEALVMKCVEHIKCEGEEHLREYLDDIVARGGEGVMLRKPESIYEGKRSKNLLKVKTFLDGDAVVIGYTSGKGRLQGLAGSLVCKTRDGVEFSCGSGLNDFLRNDPPKIGTTIIYKYQSVSPKGVPRFPTFVGIRAD